MPRVKDSNKNEARIPENPCSLPISLPMEEIGLTIVILNNIVQADQIFITATAGLTKQAGSTPTELIFRIRRGGVDGVEVYKRVRTIYEIGSYGYTTLTHVESGISSSVQMYTLTVQMTKGAPAEAIITDLVSMSGVVYGN
ncbi:hypothetical protein [Paenibacillus sp. Soil787]|uniref:hypothetical protein n=1 Tax=Paenibacillus sp. Soil787 TaxID=1736411 RepID=UPI0007032143|nr:hypothetical protein [Paenibacillus sp. Soil787]KRF18688.1 hypothetical protein ASG93_11710 [Paenibacillus sp. Soil787]